MKPIRAFFVVLTPKFHNFKPYLTSQTQTIQK
jgi:hypothetical protein